METADKKELVNHPLHYGGDTPYEAIKVFRHWLTPEQYKGFCLGSALKYLCRLGKKDNNVQELKKSRFYLDRLIEAEGGIGVEFEGGGK